LGAATVASKMHPLLLAFYAAISITAFIAYALDKSAARDGRWRIAENTLHLLALLGGWPVRCWRNTACAKSSKPAFLIILGHRAAQRGALGLLLTPTGGRASANGARRQLTSTGESAMRLLFHLASCRFRRLCQCGPEPDRCGLRPRA
jgi:uncharacterized membrane protein YsdA (DUF1294 family)